MKGHRLCCHAGLLVHHVQSFLCTMCSELLVAMAVTSLLAAACGEAAGQTTAIVDASGANACAWRIEEVTSVYDVSWVFSVVCCALILMIMMGTAFAAGVRAGQTRWIDADTTRGRAEETTRRIDLDTARGRAGGQTRRIDFDTTRGEVERTTRRDVSTQTALTHTSLRGAVVPRFGPIGHYVVEVQASEKA